MQKVPSKQHMIHERGFHGMQPAVTPVRVPISVLAVVAAVQWRYSARSAPVYVWVV